MPRRSVDGRLVLLVAVLVLAGCTGATTSPPSGAAATLAPATPTAAPSATIAGTPVSLAEPPPASLAAEGGDPVTGSLGSFTWGDGGSDSPWLPGAPIAVAAGEPLTVTIAPGAPVGDWTAKRIPSGTSAAAGAIGMGDGRTSPIAFPAPAPGAWSVQVTVAFGDDLGTATYYWQVTVR